VEFLEVSLHCCTKLYKYLHLFFFLEGGKKDTGFADRFGGFVSTFFLSIFFLVQLGCLDERLVLCAKIGVFVFCCVFFS
jgi:hypothetical protein